MSTLTDIELTFQMLAAYAAGGRNLEMLADTTPAALEEWPQEIKQLWGTFGQINCRYLAGKLVKCYLVPELILDLQSLITDRMREILSERTFATGPGTTLQALGERYGLTRERVRQIEKRAIQKLDVHLNERTLFGAIIWRAKALRERLGTGVPRSDASIESELAWASQDLISNNNIDLPFARSLMLWLAGPYKLCGPWLLAEKRLPESTLTELLKRRDGRGLIPESEITETLTGFGVKAKYHEKWLSYLRGFSRVEGGVIYFHGSILDRAHALLRFHGRPLGVEELVKNIGEVSTRSFRGRLINDSRFWRINKQCEFVIADTPGYDEYTKITDEIIQEIETCGGTAPFNHLVEKISRDYGVKESSVILYLKTPKFTTDKNNIVRVFDTSISVDIPTDITKSAACYQSNGETWCWRVLVNEQMMRGSSRAVPNSFARILGCDIGHKIKVETECGPLVVSWLLGSLSGALIGSLRRVVEYYEAQPGDYIFVKATKPQVTFECLDQDSLRNAGSDLIRLSLLLGCGPQANDAEACASIAKALGLSALSNDERLSRARRSLQARGETELAELIALPDLSVDDCIANIGRLLER